MAARNRFTAWVVLVVLALLSMIDVAAGHMDAPGSAPRVPRLEMERSTLSGGPQPAVEGRDAAGQATPHPSTGRAPSAALACNFAQDVCASPEHADALDLRRLHPNLRRALLESEGAADFVPIIIEWRQVPGKLGDVAQAAVPDKIAQRRAIVAALQADADRGAAALLVTLDSAAAQGQARNVRSFWISPVIALDARPDLIAELAQHPDVTQVRPDAQIALAPIPFAEASLAGDALPWHLAMVNVGLAQTALGLDGSGVVVANLDTGVDWQHPALLAKYRGYRGRSPAIHYGNWHVSTDEGYLYPGDGYGHGTHTMGTMLGDDGAGRRIGVAPGARWIAVKVFNNAGYTLESWIHDAFQWVMAPEGDPALAPDIVNNSWGSDTGSDERFRSDVIALRAAGILPVFSAGNNGPFPNTVGSPASFSESFAVAAVDDEKLVARFSSRGPSPWGEVKPEIAAPGVNIVSSFPGGGYRSADGTSMAAPHVAGVAALLLQADPALTPDQLEALLIDTAEPLGTTIPNQATGWGLVNAYAAGMRATDSGQVVGRVLRRDGGGIANAAITATSHSDEPPVTVSGDASGAFSLALRPGLYDLTGEAFSFAPATVPGIEVSPGVSVAITFILQPLPTAVVFGRVTDADTGAPLAATIVAVDTPATAESDPATGLYSLALPPGEYALTLSADAHRISRRWVTLAAGSSVAWDAALPQAPSILLVDSGRWYYASQIAYFTDALGALDYTFDLWPIRDPYGMNTGVDDRPTAADFQRYDAVIWSAPSDAPGLIGLSPALAEYLEAGGHLLVSGEDVAFWDGGGSPFEPWATYLTDLLAVRFAAEGNLDDLVGTAGTLFDGLRLALNTPDSARQQLLPDSAVISDALMAAPVLAWPDGAIGGTIAGVCRPYRGAWLGFGLEGAGPRAARIDALGRFLDWFATAPAAHSLVADGDTAPLIGLAGTVVTQTVTLNNTGIESDAVKITVEGGPWLLDLTMPDGSHITTSGAYTVTSCSQITMTAGIAIPPGAPRDTVSTHVLRFESQGGPAVSAAITLTAKTPAPVLLVDDERWYHHEGRYIETLQDLGIGHDRIVTRGGVLASGADILPRYPLVVWWTGYDWYQPLAAEDMTNLAAYLDVGGRLLFSSQDLLDVNGDDPFVADRFGVIGASLSITATEVSGLSGGPLREHLGPWPLTYPFRNWSDSLFLAPVAQATLHDEHLYTVAAVRPAEAWRTAFFAFPLETLADSARRTLLGRTLLWLSPLGESRLAAPPAAAAGSRIPITLTLGLADAAPRAGLRATLPLLFETALVPGSLRGPWTYDAADNALVWAGDLAPGVPITLSAELQLAADIPAGTILPLAARLDAGDGLILPAEAPVQVDVPWLTLTLAAPDVEAAPGDVLDFELTAVNIGAVGTTARLTQTLPTGLAVVPDSLRASSGAVSATADRLTWTDALTAGASATIRFQVTVTLPRPGGRLVTRADLTDDRGRLVSAWAVVYVPARVYLPVVVCGG